MNKEFMDLINKCLFSKLGDFNKVMETATLLKEFMSLSYEGMKYLLCRNDITTESEDIVFILVKLWMTEGEGSMIPLECRREIGNLIRLINNCEILLTQIVPKQDWIDISDDEIIYLKQLKNYKNLKQGMIGDNFQFQKEEIFKSNVSWFLKNRLLSHCCPKTCFLFNLDMQSILQWKNENTSTPFIYQFTYKQGCIVFNGSISISDTDFCLNMDTPMIYRLNLPIVYTYHGLFV